MTNLWSFMDLEKEFSKFSKNCLARQKNDNIFKISLKFHFFTTNGPLNILDINITKKIAFIGPQELLKNCTSNCPPQAVEEPAPSVGKGKKGGKKPIIISSCPLDNKPIATPVLVPTSPIFINFSGLLFYTCTLEAIWASQYGRLIR